MIVEYRKNVIIKKKVKCWMCRDKFCGKTEDPYYTLMQFKSGGTKNFICRECARYLLSWVNKQRKKWFINDKPKKTSTPTQGMQPFGECNHTYGKNGKGRCANCDKEV